MWGYRDLRAGENPVAIANLTLKLKHVTIGAGVGFITNQRFMFYIFAGRNRGHAVASDWNELIGWRLDRADPRTGRTGLVVVMPGESDEGYRELTFFPSGPLPRHPRAFFEAFAAEFDRAHDSETASADADNHQSFDDRAILLKDAHDALVSSGLPEGTWALDDLIENRHCLLRVSGSWIAGFFEQGELRVEFRDPDTSFAVKRFIALARATAP